MQNYILQRFDRKNAIHQQRRGETWRLVFMPQPECDKFGEFFGNCYLYWGVPWLFPKLNNTSFIAANIRSSHRRCSIKKAGLENFAICTGKHLSRSFFLTKLQTCNFIKKRLQHRLFLWILRNFQEHLIWETSTNGSRIFFCSEVCLRRWNFLRWHVLKYCFYVRKL